MRSSPARTGYLPSLDGWRAVAIAGVLLAHERPLTICGLNVTRYQEYGAWGVFVFFSISGLLICTRILEEESAMGRFRLRGFYVRRLFRIEPAALAYLAMISVLMAAGVAHDQWGQWAAALLLFGNYTQKLSSGTYSFFVSHFWTLAIEEHFYLVLSLFLVLVRRRRASILAAGILLLIVGQQLLKQAGMFSGDVSPRRTHWLIQYLLFPALLALLLRLPTVKTWAVRVLHPWVAYLGTAAALVVYRMVSAPHKHLLSAELVSRASLLLFLCFSFFVAATVLHPRSLSTRLLEWQPMRFFGRLSYSVYLWHMLFFVPAQPGAHVAWPPLVWLGHRPQKYVATLLMAMASYYFIEKPLIRVGHRIAPPVTPGHRDLEAGRAAHGEREFSRV